jgi:hypothetical protein
MPLITYQVFYSFTITEPPMKKQLIAVSLLALSSCKNDYKRDVFLGMQLGSSLATFEDKYHQLMKSGVMKRYTQDDDAIWYYPCTVKSLGRDYYAIPLCHPAAGDTLTASIEVIYFNDLHNSNYHMSSIAKGHGVYTLSSFTDDIIPTKVIKADVLDGLTAKYGQYDTRDTLTYADTYNGRNIEKYQWKNKNGVDVTLTQTVGYINPDYKGPRVKNEGLVLEYRYTDDMEKKVFAGAHIY